MSGEETQSGTVLTSVSQHGGENGMSNSGFDDPGKAGDHGSTSGIYLRHGGSQQTDLKNNADESYQHYVSDCAGAYGRNGLPSEQQNVSYSPFLNLSIIHQIM